MTNHRQKHRKIRPRSRYYFPDESCIGNQSQPVGGSTPISILTDQIRQARARGYFSYELTVEIEGGQQKVWIGVEDLIGGRISIMPQELDF